MRYNVPGWYGVGTAVASVAEKDSSAAETMRRLYQQWDFFKTVVDNAQQEMARARLSIAAHYASAIGHDQGGAALHQRIAEEFDRATRAILDITGKENLLDNSPVIQRAIEARNPYTDVLNLIQVELMNRHRSGAEPNNDLLQSTIFLSINGIAAAMQSTG